MDNVRSDTVQLTSYRLFDPPANKASQDPSGWKGDSFSFHDVIDMLNPLQHLPVISTFYRWATGDQIGNIPRVMGDTLYGGPLGLLSGLVGAEIKQESGKDIGEHVMAFLGGPDAPTDTPAPGAESPLMAAQDASGADTAPPPPT